MLHLLAPYLLSLCFLVPKEPEEARVQRLFQEFTSGYRALHLPDFGYGYEQNFRTIASPKDLQEQQQLFTRYRQALSRVNREKLLPATRYDFDQLRYETDMHLERLRLEQLFRAAKEAQVPADGLSRLPQGKAWYAYYVQRCTSVQLTPEALMQFGEQEVAHAQQQIRQLQAQLGYAHDSAGFYRHLQEPRFFLTSEAQVLARYDSIKTVMTSHLSSFATEAAFPELLIRSMPDAGPNAPPAYYFPADEEDNATGKGIFYFSFYGQRHNIRQMEWMFLHEGIPGHHYQLSLWQRLPERPPFQALFRYPGNFEGWAAYVEAFGRQLGLYQDPYRELGRWEWDLVRSARIVLDAGIHARGWTREQSLAYWNRTVPGAAEIAEREVARVTRWPAQVLTYKIGQDRLRQLRAWAEQEQGSRFDDRAFHTLVLHCGQRPLPVVERMVKERLRGNGS